MGLGHNRCDLWIDGEEKSRAQDATNLAVEHRRILAIGELVTNQRQSVADLARGQDFNQPDRDLDRRDAENGSNRCVIDIVRCERAELIEQR
jgi:hypothetical protein